MRLSHAAALSFAAVALAACGQAPPTDKAMISAFEAKRATFEALRPELIVLAYRISRATMR